MGRGVYSLKCGAVTIFFITLISILNFYIGVDLYAGNDRSKSRKYIIQTGGRVTHFAVNQNVSQVKVYSGDGQKKGFFSVVEESFVVLSNAVVEPARGHGKRGGEVINEVQNQSELDEYFTLDPGYFSIECHSVMKHSFKTKSRLEKWMKVLTCRNETISQTLDTWNSSWTIAFNRTDYANLYITMIDFYNAFLLVKSFKIDVADLTILWIDGHPIGALDNTWTSLFGRVVRAGALKRPTFFKKLLWSPAEPLPGRQPHFFEEFRAFFLERHDLSTDHKRNCSRLNITFVWRHDYLAHPRKMTGFVERKIKNEAELLNATITAFPSHHVTGVQLDKLNMASQLGLVSTTDIFVGMHGAGLTHTMFLPKTSALLELFPYKRGTLSHMHDIARARSLLYDLWINNEPKNHLAQGYTYVKVPELTDKIKNLTTRLCH